MFDLNLLSVLGLAAADAVNPCELAVLILALVAILTRFPRDRKRVLKVGLSFTAAIFIMYFLYGLVLINLFKFLTELGAIQIWLYRALGAIGILLGASIIKDYFKYGAAGYVTEVPRKWRPTMKNLISKISSPKGAFITGIIVSLFLTPCTMGPYIICCGVLEPLSFLEVIPWLLIYNIVFILPMIGITLAVYLGFSTVESVSGWREKNIKLLHLIAGIILVIIGIALLFGWLY
jgi:cytochrome c biogenesis protein CcdA